MRSKIFILACLILAFSWGTDCLAQSRIEPARSWGYQLQLADPVQLAACKYDVLVMDYSANGTDTTAYTASQIKAIKDRGKTVLAYLSIGEAENYLRRRPGCPTEYLDPGFPSEKL